MNTNKDSLFKISIKEESLIESGSVRYLFGIIFYNVNGYVFPEEMWYDFVLDILLWWIEKILDLYSGKETFVVICFMEGSFLATVGLKENSQCEIKLIEGCKECGEQEIIHKEITIPLYQLKNEVLEACKTLIDAIKKPEEFGQYNDYLKLKEKYEELSNIVDEDEGP